MLALKVDKRFEKICGSSAFLGAVIVFVGLTVSDFAQGSYEASQLPILLAVCFLFVLPVMFAVTFFLGQPFYRAQLQSRKPKSHWFRMYLAAGFVGGVIAAVFVLGAQGMLFMRGQFPTIVGLGAIYTLMGIAVSLLFWLFTAFGPFRVDSHDT